MIIDRILDRYDAEEWKGSRYDSEEWGRDVYGYTIGERWLDHLGRALDAADEKALKKALCKYIDDAEYNPRIKNYVNARTWASDVPVGVKLKKIKILD